MFNDEGNAPASSEGRKVSAPVETGDTDDSSANSIHRNCKQQVEYLLTLPLASTARVLVVEDMKGQQEAISQALSKMGVATVGKVEIVDNADDAAKALLNGEYDLVILDQSFPRRSGKMPDESTLNYLLRELRTKGVVNVKAVTNSTNLSADPKSGEYADYQQLLAIAKQAGVHIVGSLEKGAPVLLAAKKVLSNALRFED